MNKPNSSVRTDSERAKFLGEIALRVFRQHGFATQWWSDQEGYTVVCRCGHEILVGHQKIVVDLPKSEEHLRLLAIDRPLTDEEGRMLSALAGGYRQTFDARFTAQSEHLRQQRMNAIDAHVQSQFETAFLESCP